MKGFFCKLNKLISYIMDQIKRRGPQYFLLITIVLLSFFVNIYFKTKPKIVNKTTSIKKKQLLKKDMKGDKKESFAINDSLLIEVDTVKISIKESMEKEMKTKPTSINSYFSALYKSYHAVKNETRTDLVIRYYRKEKDKNMVNSLKSLGFYIHERPTAPKLKDLYSNTIYYGDSVRREDILITAYQLKSAGMKLQAVEHSQFGDNWKSHSIELGTDITKLKAPELSLGAIKDIIENNPYLKTHL